MTFKGLDTFINSTVGSLPQEKRDLVYLLFFNPTDSASAVFEAFGEWDGIERLDAIIQTAKALRIDNAERIEDLFVEWSNSFFDDELGDDGFAADGDDVPACPKN